MSVPKTITTNDVFRNAHTCFRKDFIVKSVSKFFQNCITSLIKGGPHFCSMKITEDVRKYAAEQSLTEEDAVKRGLEEKAAEFVEKGGEVYMNG